MMVSLQPVTRHAASHIVVLQACKVMLKRGSQSDRRYEYSTTRTFLMTQRGLATSAAVRGSRALPRAPAMPSSMASRVPSLGFARSPACSAPER